MKDARIKGEYANMEIQKRSEHKRIKERLKEGIKWEREEAEMCVGRETAELQLLCSIIWDLTVGSCTCAFAHRPPAFAYMHAFVCVTCEL